MFVKNGKIPVRWWNLAPNFGDQLSPWLVSKIAGKATFESPQTAPHYLVVGSILYMTQPLSVVWGSGSFGFDPKEFLCETATYLAVRGPLTRNKLVQQGVRCPRVFGDPALLTPEFHKRKVEPVHELGLVLRWSEDKWNDAPEIEGVKKIFLKTGAVEETLDAMLSCKRIVTSSLHGLILADAYDIPNAWLASGTPNGGEFKFWDYFISVDKLRDPQPYDLGRRGLTLKTLLADFKFDDRPIRIDLDRLKAACPFGWGPATIA